STPRIDSIAATSRRPTSRLASSSRAARASAASSDCASRERSDPMRCNSLSTSPSRVSSSRRAPTACSTRSTAASRRRRAASSAEGISPVSYATETELPIRGEDRKHAAAAERIEGASTDCTKEIRQYSKKPSIAPTLAPDAPAAGPAYIDYEGRTAICPALVRTGRQKRRRNRRRFRAGWTASSHDGALFSAPDRTRPTMIDLAKHKRMANAIRALSMDAVEKANSGHPGMPMGMADVATVLFSQYLKFDPADPAWPDRDRFVLSAGHGSMLLYSLLFLTGYPGMTIGEIERFRQLHSKTPGHPENFVTAGVEATTGPLGQGVGAS